MRIRSLAATLFVAVALTACGDSATPTSPASRAVAPAAPHFDLVTTGNEINSLIDQIFASPIVRMYAHAEWNWIAAQVANCPSSPNATKLQTFLNQFESYLSTTVPKNNTVKAQLFRQLVADMSSYVNEAISACTTP